MAFQQEKPSTKTNQGGEVLVLPYPLQGHINPILQFAKRLAYKGVNVTVLIPSSISKQSSSLLNNHHSIKNLHFIQIFDGYNEEPDKSDITVYLTRLKTSISHSMSSYILHCCNSNYKTVIYDSLMPWVLDVVKKHGLEGAPFFTQSNVVNSIYYHVSKGNLKAPITDSSLVSIPAVKSFLTVDDLPSFATSHAQTYPVEVVNMVVNQFLNVDEVSCLFVNTLDKLEIEVINWMENIYPVKTIGPCIPSKYLENSIPDDIDYGLSLFKAETDACLQWLHTRQDGSVVYVSMGSMASLEPNQMEEIAMALANCNRFFLWVVRKSEENKLPLNFKEKVIEKGLIANWCPQLEVLSHRAIGCFVTHCGWNSTLEAISLGVPVVGFPQWSDQLTNAKCVKDFWGVGDRVKCDENGFVTREEIELCIREVMDGESGKKMRNNAKMWMKLAKDTMLDGGTSAKNIDEFVAKLQCL